MESFNGMGPDDRTICLSQCRLHEFVHTTRQILQFAPVDYASNELLRHLLSYRQESSTIAHSLVGDFVGVELGKALCHLK